MCVKHPSAFDLSGGNGLTICSLTIGFLALQLLHGALWRFSNWSGFFGSATAQNSVREKILLKVSKLFRTVGYKFFV